MGDRHAFMSELREMTYALGEGVPTPPKTRIKRPRTPPKSAHELLRQSRPFMSHRVGLFVTCLVDLVRPQVGFAAVKLLEDAGCTVEVPATQTCCGQPAWNAGADAHAADIARQVIDAFEPFDYVVAPSGSCAGMIKNHYPEALANDAGL